MATKTKKPRKLTEAHKAAMQEGRRRARERRQQLELPLGTRRFGSLGYTDYEQAEAKVQANAKRVARKSAMAQRAALEKLVGKRKTSEATIKKRLAKLKKSGDLPTELPWSTVREIYLDEMGSFRKARSSAVPTIREERRPRKGKVGSISSWEELKFRGRPVEGRIYYGRQFDTGDAVIARASSDDPWEALFTPKRKGSKQQTLGFFSSRKKALEAVMERGTPLEYGIEEPKRRGRPRKQKEDVTAPKRRGRPRKYQTTEEVIGRKMRGRKRKDKPADKQFRNWKWNSEILPSGDEQLYHNAAGYGQFIVQEHKGGFFAGFKPPRSNAYGIKPDGTLTPNLGGRGLKFDSKNAALAQLRVFAKSIGANPRTGENEMPISLVPARRRSSKNSPAFRKVEKKLADKTRLLAKRNKEVRNYRMETEGGHLAKAITVTGGVVTSALMPGAIKKPGTDQPALTRNGRRAVRLGIGVPLALWGRRYHPLAALFGWAFAGTEVVFTALEMAKRVDSGKTPEYGYFGEPEWEVGAGEDDFFDEEEDVMIDGIDDDELGNISEIDEEDEVMVI